MDYMRTNMRAKSIPFIFIALFTLQIDAQFQQGRDYQRISSVIPIKKDGKVEVIEAFWYGCGACFSFEPTLNRWRSDLDDDTKFSKLPVAWGPIHQLHAKLFYTIEALNLGSNGHNAVFNAIHKEGNYLTSDNAIIDFLGSLGVEEADVLKQINSFSVKQKVKRSIELSKKLKVNGVPMMFVDGTFKVQAQRNHNDMLDIIDYLIKIQKPNS
jgi:Protein-disulfide isomerase